MIAPTVTATPTLAQLQHEALYQRQTAEIHWDVCRNRMMERFCLRCDQLDTAAFAAERAYLEANRG